MQIVGLEEARAPLTHGVFAVRFTCALAPAAQDEAWEALADAGVTVHIAPAPEEGRSSSRFLAGVWNPPAPDALELVRTVLERLETVHGAEAAWFFQVATEAIADDGEGEDEEDDEADDEPADYDEDEDPDEAEADAIDPGAADEEDAGDWKNGPPPGADKTPFPLEGYPAILQTFDWEDFGLALKLEGEPIEGEEQVLEAMHGFWIRPYIDSRLLEEAAGAAEEADDDAEDADDDDDDDDDGPDLPYRHTAVTRDVPNHAALLWVDRFGPPATVEQMVHHLLWVANQLHQILPIAHARFAEASMRMKYGALTGDDSPFVVLAGNPLATRFDEGGDAAAAAWAETQQTWGPAELAAMYLELGMRNDPDEPEQAAIALAMFDRAFSLDPTCADARLFAILVLVRGGNVTDALQRAQQSGDSEVCARTLGLVAEKRPDALKAVRALLQPETFAHLAGEGLAEILVAIATHDPEALEAALGAIADDPALVPYVFNASFQLKDQHAQLRVLERVLAMPEPEEGREREEYLKAYNNACVLANTLKDYARAAAIADDAQRFAAEDPYIYHAAACAYACVGQGDRALDQVRSAIAAGYDHVDQIEVDHDLSAIRETPEFKALFAEWRANRPVREGTAPG